MSIVVNSVKDIKVVRDNYDVAKARYFIITRADDKVVVVSAVAGRAYSHMQTSPTGDYRFAARTGSAAQSWSQYALLRSVRSAKHIKGASFILKNYLRNPTQLELKRLKAEVRLTVINEESSRPVQAVESTVPEAFSGGYIIGGFTKSGAIAFSKNPKVHATESQAMKELQRLANLSPGQTFIVMKAVATAVTKTTEVKKFI